MNVMAGIATPTFQNVDFFFGKNPNPDYDSLFFFYKKRVQSPSDDTFLHDFSKLIDDAPRASAFTSAPATTATSGIR